MHVTYLISMYSSGPCSSPSLPWMWPCALTYADVCPLSFLTLNVQHHWLAFRDGPPRCYLVSIMQSSFCSEFPHKHVLFHLYIFHIKFSDMFIVEGKHQWMNERLQLFPKHSITILRLLWNFLGLNCQLSSKLWGQIATEMWIQIDILLFLMPLCS